MMYKYVDGLRNCFELFVVYKFLSIFIAVFSPNFYLLCILTQQPQKKIIIKKKCQISKVEFLLNGCQNIARTAAHARNTLVLKIHVDYSWEEYQLT